MKEKFVKIGWYLVIWFLFMIFTVVMAKPLADNGFPVPTSSIFINTIICFLIPYLIYRKFMNYKATHEIKIKNIFAGLAIYFFVIVVLVVTLHDANNSYNTADEIKTEKIENIDAEKNFDEEEKLAAEKKAAEEKLAAEKKAEEERLAAEKKAAEEKLAAEKKVEEERLAAEKKAAEEKLAAEKKVEEERLAAEKKSEQEKPVAEKNDEPGLIDKAKEKIKDLATSEIEKMRQEAENLVEGEVFVGHYDFIEGVPISVDCYVLPKTVKPYIYGIVFKTDEGFKIHVAMKDPNTGKKMFETVYAFDNNNNILEDESNVKFWTATPAIFDDEKFEGGKYIENNKVALEIYRVSKKFSLLK